MNLSLRNRVAASFVIANMVILVLGFMVFHYLNSLNKDIKRISLDYNRVMMFTDDIRLSAVSILKYQRKLMANPSSQENIDKLISLCESFSLQLQSFDSLYKGMGPETSEVISKMSSHVESLQFILKKGQALGRENIMDSISDLADKILDSLSAFQDVQYVQSSERDEEINRIIDKTKKHMMYTLIITFLFTMVLVLVIPGKIALPFKKINDTIRELQDCNFDVSIAYDGDDEIGEIAREMNKMIGDLKKFEELRADKISIEARKFDALANAVRKLIMVANAKGELIYMNNLLYSLLQCQSDEIMGKNMKDTLIPDSIIDIYSMAIKRRSKIENAEILIPRDAIKSSAIDVEDLDKSDLSPLFQGYANVIPIRGKESSLDYYLMVLSDNVFV